MKDPMTFEVIRRQKESSTTSSAVSDQTLRQVEQNYQTQISAYTKEGYYQYFLSILEENPIELVEIFVDFNFENMFLEDAAYMSYEEYQQVYYQKLDDVLSHLNEEDYSVIKTRVYYSFIEFKVNREALTSLYNNSSVRRIVHPEAIKTHPNYREGGRIN